MKRFQSLEGKVTTEIIESFQIVWDHLGLPGSWWTGEERIGIASEVRKSNPRKLWENVGELKNYAKDSDEILSPYVKAVVRIVANETSKIDQQIYGEIIKSIGEDKYAELAALVSQVIAIDHLCDALGIEREELPEPKEGDPRFERPHGLVDGVAFLPTFSADDLPHVAVSLSLAQADNARRMLLVRAMYSGSSFGEMVWEHRNLTRPQIELVAARTSALNECFY
jgi:hypothetical protein|tara:strand:- start:3428 stop:4102 length:675 start_codon:yes stop_codon:yes gene_type:complete